MRWRVGFVLSAALLGMTAPALAQGNARASNPDFSWMFAEGKPQGVRTVISGSMTPSLQVGDRVAVFTMTRAPKRGDVLLFHHPKFKDGVPFVKRVVGLPGDRVKVENGRLFLNGEQVERKLVREFSYLDPHNWMRVMRVYEYTEQLPGEDQPHTIHELSDTRTDDNTPEFEVPDGHLFMMGDNRDLSEDSRAASGHRPDTGLRKPGTRYTSVTLPDKHASPAIGFVPIDQVMGRVRTVMMSINPCDSDRATAAGAECLASGVNKRM